MTSTLIKT